MQDVSMLDPADWEISDGERELIEGKCEFLHR